MKNFPEGRRESDSDAQNFATLQIALQKLGFANQDISMERIADALENDELFSRLTEEEHRALCEEFGLQADGGGLNPNDTPLGRKTDNLKILSELHLLEADIARRMSAAGVVQVTRKFH